MSWFNATTWGQLQEKDKDGERKETHERGFLYSNDHIAGVDDPIRREKVRA